MRAFVVTVSEADRELAVDTLFRGGVAAVEERVGEADGVVELWTHVGDDSAAIGQAAATVRPGWSWRTVDVDETIAQSWRDHVGPTWVADDLVIVPAWVAPGVDRTDRTVVVIDPGAAFGLGDHPTTVLTLRSFLDVVARSRGQAPETVLDVGCGSGVLGIAAALVGTRRVVAVDHHPAAVEAAIENSLRNGVGDRMDVSGQPLSDVEETFDVVLANLLGPTLVELASGLIRVTAPTGRLIVSGLLDGRYEHVVSALAPMVEMNVRRLDGWVAIELRHACLRPLTTLDNP